MSALAEIAALLRQRIGFDAETVGARSLAHAVRGRVQARGLHDAAAYLAVLGKDAAEWEALLEAVVVPETWFFRDRAPFTLLGNWVARHWSRRSAADPVVVLSLPCASGEEAWSIAIALRAAGLPADAFRVEAVDLSARALATARAGVYPPRALRGRRVELQWQRYLRTAADGRVEVADELRGSVRFRRGNLVGARELFAGHRFDCIFSRNLLIYCDAATRAEALATFADLLLADGLLVLGHAETVPPGTPGFVRETPAGAFAWRRGEAPARRATTPRASVPLPVKPHGAASRRASHAVARRAAPAARTDALAEARRLADRGELAAAAALAESRVAAAPADADAQALLGIILAAQGRDAEAIEALRRALYLTPTHSDALVHLALVLERAGDTTAATRLRQRLRRSEANG